MGVGHPTLFVLYGIFPTSNHFPPTVQTSRRRSSYRPHSYVPNHVDVQDRIHSRQTNVAVKAVTDANPPWNLPSRAPPMWLMIYDSIGWWSGQKTNGTHTVDIIYNMPWVNGKSMEWMDKHWKLWGLWEVGPH